MPLLLTGCVCVCVCVRACVRVYIYIYILQYIVSAISWFHFEKNVVRDQGFGG